MKNICVLGAGYVGLVTGACFADLGNNVICLDIDESKIDALNQGEIPIYEPGLAEIVERNVRAQRLRFTTSYEEGLRDAEIRVRRRGHALWHMMAKRTCNTCAWPPKASPRPWITP